ncbi:RabJ-like protein [Giardia duodenalis]|uniref:RabJ-like protein n=2 Tax=Giardia intestinalis TaxID=5741 RepID=E2RTY9_GIAIC|nr:RabJ-like protein [Giardia intestinalis]AAL87242.1 RabB [Giardia intestinalis]KAE8303359.1 RabJ-like protein [Giardia intestinalis]DAA01322.1 TPA_exp: RBJ protein [Giardia intestinalis]|eukprot:XP_001703990.1 RabB [Giardia lamblia ATCC 50803]
MPPPPISNKPLVVRLKVTTAGMSQVGKSCLIKYYCEGRFVKKYLPTIGVDYGVRALDLEGCTVRINFFDLSGLDEYQDIRKEFYSDTQGLLLIFDMSNRDSFTALEKYYGEFIKSSTGAGAGAGSVSIYVIGTKADLPAAVSVDEATTYASRLKGVFFKVSSCTGDGVAPALNTIFKQLFSKAKA